MAKRHLSNKKQYNTHSCTLQELQVGGSVQVQHQCGTISMAVGQNRERCRNFWKHAIPYTDGQQRRFLRKILPVENTPEILPKQLPPQRPRLINSEPPGDTPELMEVDAMDDDRMMVDHHTTDMELEENQHPIYSPASPILWRSTWVTWPPRPQSPQMRGPTHDYSESSRQLTITCWHWGYRGGHEERKNSR